MCHILTYSWIHLPATLDFLLDLGPPWFFLYSRYVAHPDSPWAHLDCHLNYHLVSCHSTCDNHWALSYGSIAIAIDLHSSCLILNTWVIFLLVHVLCRQVTWDIWQSLSHCDMATIVGSSHPAVDFPKLPRPLASLNLLPSMPGCHHVVPLDSL